MTDTVNTLTDNATTMMNQAKARTETIVADMQTKAKDAADKGQELAKDAVEFTKGNVEAMVESAKITAKGVEAMATEFVSFAKTSMTDTTENAKRYAAVKTPTEFFALHTDVTKAALDAMVKQGSKSVEMTVKLANDAFQPISSRVALAMSKLKNAA